MHPYTNIPNSFFSSVFEEVILGFEKHIPTFLTILLSDYLWK